jgi:hypothetical protein
VESGDGLDTLVGTGRRQRQAQAKGGNGPLPAAQSHVFATGVEQRFGKDPLELVRDHAKLSVIHLASFRCFQNHTRTRSFGWIARKIHNEIKCLKVPTYEFHLIKILTI